jgi:hypothetical protein
MRPLLSPALILALLLLSTGCGDAFIRGAIQTGSTIQGTVGVVQLDTDEAIEVTFVTLVQNGISSTIGFCGDQSALFPLDQIVRVNFNPGTQCATVIAVVIV